MDSETITRVTEKIEWIADRVEYPIQELIIFGSRAREDFRPESDVDILVVSTAFDGMPTHRRTKLFYRHWDYDRLPDPELICLTPHEFEAQKETRPHIVRTAVEEGVSVM